MRRITRRDFIKITATAGAATAVLTGCQSPRSWVIVEPYVRPPEEQLAGQATWYASTCQMCPAGCGIVVRIMNGRAVKIEGNPEHPINLGKTCPRGQAGLQVLYNPDRFSGPARQSARGSSKLEALTWDGAITQLRDRLSAAGDRVAVWGGTAMSGHLVDLFTRFTAALGAPPPLLYDLGSAYHGEALQAGAGQALFGVQAMPSYDVGNADVVFSFGADLLGAGVSSTRYGIEYGRLRDQSLGKRGYLAQFEPRMSNTGAKADEWVPVKPGTEGVVAQALLRLMADQGVGPQDRVARAKAMAGSIDARQAAIAGNVSLDDLTRLARIFATADKAVAIPGGPLMGYGNATAHVQAVQSLNLAVGRVGQPGGPIVTPTLSQPGIVSAPAATYADAKRLIDRMKAGQVQVLLVHGANPAYDLPEASGFMDALQKVPFVVSFAPLPDDTSLWADLVLPDHTYLEGWGYRVPSPTFGVPVISAQQPVVSPYSAFDSRATADVLLSVAQGMPKLKDALHWSDEVVFLKEAVNQLPAGIYGGANADVRWTQFLQHGNWNPGTRANPAPAAPPNPQPVQVGEAPFQGDTSTYPYYLHLNMTPMLGDGRGASLPWLQGSPDPMTTIQWQTWVELNPQTANQLGVKYGDIVRVASPSGSIEVPVYVYPAIRPDTVSIPLGQGHTGGARYALNRGSNPLRLLGGQADTTNTHLAWANTRVSVTPTGRHVALATFESTLGVTQGFPNKGFPGQ